MYIVKYFDHYKEEWSLEAYEDVLTFRRRLFEIVLLYRKAPITIDYEGGKDFDCEK